LDIFLTQLGVNGLIENEFISNKNTKVRVFFDDSKLETKQAIQTGITSIIYSKLIAPEYWEKLNKAQIHDSKNPALFYKLLFDKKNNKLTRI